MINLYKIGPIVYFNNKFNNYLPTFYKAYAFYVSFFSTM